MKDVGREDAAALEKAATLQDQQIPERLSVMTLYELYWGIGYVDRPQAERDNVDAILGTKEVYPVTPAIARKAGRIAGELTRRDEPLNDPSDELIGATGFVHEEPVLTKNVGHFDQIPNLEVETY
ncbi:type II toxin-antitoxin system VapC family toxin [Haladaptatus sp. YSMS36]|uniref:type II toxin-antitoxin system VapC family toxin n=1 Tax=Haladaptatus sp. YSMS36 TaxID=3033384 RepID=UPI0023E868A8|nr:type II toxin-antitoxin system VapC family toxin [Haladaptatus sp. YSMS36]